MAGVLPPSPPAHSPFWWRVVGTRERFLPGRGWWPGHLPPPPQGTPLGTHPAWGHLSVLCDISHFLPSAPALLWFYLLVALAILSTLFPCPPPGSKELARVLLALGLPLLGPHPSDPSRGWRSSTFLPRTLGNVHAAACCHADLSTGLAPGGLGSALPAQLL